MAEAESAADPTASVKAFVGRWSGKWDGAWEVHFTIVPGFTPGKVIVQYEWLENVGEPLWESWGSYPIDGKTLTVGAIHITLDDHDPSRAKAVGKFEKPRTAGLTRTPVPLEFMKVQAILDKMTDIKQLLHDQPLRKVMETIFKQTGLFARFDRDVYPNQSTQATLDTKVTLEAQEGVAVRDLLHQLFEPLGLAYEDKGHWIRVIPKAAVSPS